MNNTSAGDQFWAWYREHIAEDLDGLQERTAEGLGVLVEAVKAGDIVSIDGVESPLARKIAAHHGVDLFEMNANWIGSAQS
ncbi:MAG: hypothetical protein ABL931_05130 [Usitatibacteraceae bacterium]